ncbi:MAG: murein biosynthesis integral membrane protein MurJ [Longimonas sp.]
MPADAPLDSDSSADAEASPASSAAGVVAAGIFLSKMVGLLRERAIAFYFGVSAHADVWQVAFRAPNLLQNLLGEGTISAAFIPIYSRFLDNDKPKAAARFAGAIFGLLCVVVALVTLAGIALAEPIVAVLAPGYLGDAERVAAGTLSINRFELAVQAVRIVFPMAGVLVLSAWALGILNSHRQFFVPYVAPVLWNVAIIGALAAGAYALSGAPGAPDALTTDALSRLLLIACFGALVGGALQFGVQLPFVWAHLDHLRLSISTRVEGVREAMKAFGPVVAGRGVAQISGYIDLFLASLLAVGAQSAVRYAQIFYLLPVSLFGISVAASELPELSRLTTERARSFGRRMQRSVHQIAFLTIPTIVGYLCFGFLIVGLLLRTGQFDAQSNWLVYIVLGGYALGILATTVSRLLQNAFYALGDAKTPARLAVVRVVVSTIVAVPLMVWLDTTAVPSITPVSSESPLFLGALGLSLGASVGAWVEFVLLRRALLGHLPSVTLVSLRTVATLIALASGAALPALGVWQLLAEASVWISAPLVGGTYALVYLGSAWGMDRPELNAWLDRFGA